MIVNIVISIIAIAFVCAAIFSKRLLVSVVCLGLVSVLLAIIFFQLNAPFAGGFELSIGAGLISLLFIMTISFTERGRIE